MTSTPAPTPTTNCHKKHQRQVHFPEHLTTTNLITPASREERRKAFIERKNKRKHEAKTMEQSKEQTHKILCRQAFDVLRDQSDRSKNTIKSLYERDVSIKSLVSGFLDSLGTYDGNQGLELRLSTFRYDYDNDKAAKQSNRTFEHVYQDYARRKLLLMISKDKDFQNAFYPGCNETFDSQDCPPAVVSKYTADAMKTEPISRTILESGVIKTPDDRSKGTASDGSRIGNDIQVTNKKSPDGSDHSHGSHSDVTVPSGLHSPQRGNKNTNNVPVADNRTEQNSKQGRRDQDCQHENELNQHGSSEPSQKKKKIE